MHFDSENFIEILIILFVIERLLDEVFNAILMGQLLYLVVDVLFLFRKPVIIFVVEDSLLDFAYLESLHEEEFHAFFLIIAHSSKVLWALQLVKLL